MDKYWAAKENAQVAIESLKDGLEGFIQATERGAQDIPELEALPAVGDRLIILATTLLADLNERGMKADLEGIPEEIERLYRAWIG